MACLATGMSRPAMPTKSPLQQSTLTPAGEAGKAGSVWGTAVPGRCSGKAGRREGRGTPFFGSFRSCQTPTGPESDGSRAHQRRGRYERQGTAMSLTRQPPASTTRELHQEWADAREPLRARIQLCDCAHQTWHCGHVEPGGEGRAEILIELWRVLDQICQDCSGAFPSEMLGQHKICRSA